jgi:hypothetical protein
VTPAWLKEWTAHTEWLLDIHLTEQQRRECQRLWAQRWQQTDQAGRDHFSAYADAELKWWKQAAGRGEAERNELRAQRQPLVVAGLRASSDADERLLVALYDAAHEPGRERNPILVAGTPPLTQGVLDTWRRFIEAVLEVRLTERQRHEYQHLFVNDWKQSPQAVKARLLKAATEGWPGRLPLLDSPARDRLRTELRPPFLAGLRRSSEAALSRWLLAVYESAHRPGEDRNPERAPDRG